jgi:hypothetical protein
MKPKLKFAQYAEQIIADMAIMHNPSMMEDAVTHAMI